MAAAVCLMLLLPDELLTKIIIHSIKDVAAFHFLNLRNNILVNGLPLTYPLKYNGLMCQFLASLSKVACLANTSCAINPPKLLILIDI
jgi:hypothetical protein